MAPFYADDALLDGPAKGNTRMMLVLMKHGPDFGYFPEPEKSIHVCNWSEDVNMARVSFAVAGLKL
eukprot:15343834-Ditylum_brightwellii.AAC.1